MTKQDRAVRTRAALIRSAATEFDRSGYAGASMSQITKTAGLSTGALTFHFSSKSELADAVVTRARAQVVDVLDEVALNTKGTAMDRLGAVVIALARALHDDVEVRGAARLEQERPRNAPNWSADWYPVIRHLAGLACRSGDLPGSVRSDQVAALAALFVRGADLHGRTHRGHDPGGCPFEEFADLWSIARRGLLAASDPTA
ncbi:A-factor receptor protein [Streptomyces hundungensis]|uniref:A-factor receptor protein n=1 Tax=Streptomyces hundungensis TaxID=1077946 RepID=A0A387HFC5_9ACTN|nr:TetR/AcrR family transcriptional regulator [Streptomyces hundungensis]AYG82535.1 A-factor receptor protein [Streptomyces hundungensis]